MAEHRLICRSGFGFVLVARYEDYPENDFFLYKTVGWADMQEKIVLAEQLLECKCEYENFDPNIRIPDMPKKEAV